jgi:2-polyprenyl-3-methyl-5-hydroxy-6-metoxy-1,4-benzoquinol methylase
MIGKRDLPSEFREWNIKWGAPYGRTPSIIRRARRTLLHGKRSVQSRARLYGPFCWQSYNSSRIFEYPWAYHAIRRRGSHLRVLELGGGLTGLQFVLAAEGDSVVNVDPGQGARGWEYNADLHQRLCHALKAPVQLLPKKIDSLEATPHSFDVVLSVSALEHFPEADLAMLASAIRRLLNPNGIVVMTIDLFLDLKPFSEREENEWGRNLDISQFLNMAGLRLDDGNPAELFGFPEFNPAQIMSSLPTYLIGSGHPVLSQCFVARADYHD